jgi:hypothetical protein
LPQIVADAAAWDRQQRQRHAVIREQSHVRG